MIPSPPTPQPLHIHTLPWVGGIFCLTLQRDTLQQGTEAWGEGREAQVGLRVSHPAQERSTHV